MTEDKTNIPSSTTDNSAHSADEPVDSANGTGRKKREVIDSVDDSNQTVPQNSGGKSNVHTNQVTPGSMNEPDATWAYQYYSKFADICLGSDKRRGIIETLVDADYVTFSTKALADEVEDRLKTQDLLNNTGGYNNQNLNQVLPEFEPLAPVYRIPKFETNGRLGQDQQNTEYVLVPMTAMLRWLDQTDLDTDYITNKQEPDGWKTHYIGQYITNRVDDELSNRSTLVAGNLLPAKAVLQATVREYCSAGASEPSVSLQIGSLSEIRDGEIDLESILSHLTVEDVVPEPDGAFVGDDGVHDYAIVGRVSGVTTVHSKRDLQRALARQLIFWLTHAQGIYERRHTPGFEGTIDKTARQQAVNNFQQMEQLDAARERFDQDVAIIDESEGNSDDEYTIVCGLYRRSGDDSPNKP